MDERQLLAEEFERELTPERRMLVDAFRFGEDVRAFSERSPVGRYLLDRAESERQDALEAFLAAQPFDTEAMTQAKMKADVADNVLRWLGQALSEGIQAAELLQQEDEATNDETTNYD